MTRKVFTEVTDTFITETSDDLIASYVTKKQELETLDKLVKKLANDVKEHMKQNNLKSTNCNGFKITRTESQRVTWKEDLLLAKVKTYNKPELVKHIEQVDVPVLEQYVIDGAVDINDLLECQQVTDIVSLRVTKVKENNDELC